MIIWTFTWDGRNLTGISGSGLTWSATYGAGGIRLSKTVNGTVTKFFVSGSRLLAQQTDGINTWFLYDNVGRIAGILYNGTAYYYMYNVQGDVVAIVNCGTGKAVATYEYDAWGNCTVTKASGSVIGDVNPIRYRGYYYDSETGLYYLWSRYYDPRIGRFLSPDVLISARQGLQGCNLYAYCLNNPTTWCDPSGALPSYNLLVTDTGDRVRDVTEEVDNALRNYVILGNALSPHIPIPPIDVGKEAVKYYVFYRLVRDEAPWDIKRPKSWEKTIDTPFPGYGAIVKYNDMFLTPENLGNYTYGVLGREFGIPLGILLAGSYCATHFPTSANDLNNEIGDWYYIEQGFYADY